MRKRAYDPKVVDRLRTLLSYSLKTGEFRWKVKRRMQGGFCNVGDIAGTNRSGYVVIGVDGVYYRAHVLAWWFMLREDIPEGMDIDHEDRNRSNNRWSNLRLLPRSKNNMNSDPHSNNKSGVKGVSWISARNKWLARIKVDDRIIHLGEFREFADAVNARMDGELKHLGQVFSVMCEPPEKPAYKPRKRVHVMDQQAADRKKSLVKRTTNTSGYPGVRLHKKSGLWHARIVINYKETSLGYFKDFNDAKAARQKAEKVR